MCIILKIYRKLKLTQITNLSLVICKTLSIISTAFSEHNVEAVIHLAAESHLERSIHGPAVFIATNITSTFNLLEATREFWDADLRAHCFLNVSIDEVYGLPGSEGEFSESTAYALNCLYSASKAASERVRAWEHIQDERCYNKLFKQLRIFAVS